MVYDNDNDIPPTCSSAALVRCPQNSPIGQRQEQEQQQQQQQQRQRNNSGTSHRHTSSTRTRTRTCQRRPSSYSAFSSSSSSSSTSSSIALSFFFMKRIIVFQLLITCFVLFSRQESISNNNNNNSNSNHNNNNAETKNRGRQMSYFLVVASAGTKANANHDTTNNRNGFNYEIEKRVHERVSELMNIPVTMLGLVEQYTKTQVFEPPFLRPHQRDALFRFLWTVWKQFGVDIYYGQEDGLFLGIIQGSGTYQEGRGTNGYHVIGDIDDDGDNGGDGDDATTTAILSKEEEEEEEAATTSITEEDLYMKRLYYHQCLNGTSGEPEQCILEPEEEYIECYMHCILTPCNILNSNLQEELTQVTGTTAGTVVFGTVVDKEDANANAAYDYSGSSHILPQSGPQFPNRTPVRKVDFDFDDGDGDWIPVEGEVILFANGNYIVQWKDEEHSIDYYASSSANNMRTLKKLVQNAITDDDYAPHPADFEAQSTSMMSIVSNKNNGDKMQQQQNEDGEELVFWCPTYNIKQVPPSYSYSTTTTKATTKATTTTSTTATTTPANSNPQPTDPSEFSLTNMPSISKMIQATTTTTTTTTTPTSPTTPTVTTDPDSSGTSPTSSTGRTISMGYIPRYYYCLNDAGQFVENGDCTHSDDSTVVDGKTANPETYAVCHRDNYLFLRNQQQDQSMFLIQQQGYFTYNNNNDATTNDTDSNESTTETTNATSQSSSSPAGASLFSAHVDEVTDDQKCDTPFIGGYRSKRYEPRLRPWYVGVRDIQNAFWTKPYPFATNNDMGISFGKPIYYLDPTKNHNQIFRGVICVDYDLEAISKYLRTIFIEILDVKENDTTDNDGDTQQQQRSNSNSNSGATVLIVEDDEPHYIIGSSTGSAATKKVRVDDETLDCEDTEIVTGTDDCKTIRRTLESLLGENNNNSNTDLDVVMSLAFQAQKEEGFPKSLVQSAAQVEGENNNHSKSKSNSPDYYVSQSTIYEQSEGENLRWRIIVAMPVELATHDSLCLGADSVAGVVFAIALLGCMICLVLFYYYFTKRSSTEVAMSDWRFTSAFIIGCSLLNLASLTNLGPVTDQLCMLRMWSFHLCFVLALTPLLVKVWRVYTLAGSAGRFTRRSITNFESMLYTLPAILLQILILTLFSILDPSLKETDVTIAGSISSQQSSCQHDSKAFAITQIIFEGGLVVIGCILAFKSRNMGSTLGESKQLLFAMYNVALVALIVVLMRYFLTIDQQSVYVIMTVGVFWATVFGSCAFVLPRLLKVQMQEGRRSSHNRRSSTTEMIGRKGSIGRIGSMYGSSSFNYKPSNNRDRNSCPPTSTSTRTPTWYVPRMVDVSSSSLIESGEFQVKAPEHNNSEAKLKMSDVFDDAPSIYDDDASDSTNGRETGEGKNEQKSDTTVITYDVEALGDHTIDDNDDDNDNDVMEKEHDIEAMGRLDTADTDSSGTSKLTE